MSCASADVMLSHLSGKKQLMDMTTEEIKTLPLEFIIRYVDSVQLLDAWGKLPISYKTNVTLQNRLPCLYHYNNPANNKTEFDGPPNAQELCFYCNKSILTQV